MPTTIFNTKIARSFLFTGTAVLTLTWTIACNNNNSKSSNNESKTGSTDASDDSNDSKSGNDESKTGSADAGDDSSDGEAKTDALLIKLDDGYVQGETSGKSRRFLKIPYAKPPIGELRWKAPVKNDPWTGERFEKDFPDNCPQLADQGSPASNVEDCLYLNIWSPNPAPERAPVMVWIYGGGNFSGGSGIPVPGQKQLWYDGQFFASNNGVVLVTFNYRLGPLGFFAHPALAGENQPLGNQGLLDQRFALQWVQKNIDKFGGDPDNVTIFGESAGAGDVCYHMASPGSRGLFHRVIGESGGCTMGGALREKALDDVKAGMVAYGEAIGCKEGADQLACMRKVSVDDLLAQANQPSPGGGETFSTGSWSFAAIIDGPNGFLPEKPSDLFDQGNIAQVPYLLGSNNDEGATFVWRSDPITTEEGYKAYLEDSYGDKADDVFAMYPPSDFDGDYNAARLKLVGDSGVICGTRDTALRAAKAGLKVFMYNFNVPWSLAPDLLKVGHASEMSHVFGNPLVPDNQSSKVTEDSQKVADAMNAYWSRFAKNGDPNGKDAPAVWPEFTADDDERLQLDSGWEVLKDFRSKECAFWSDYYRNQ
jgi:para-nitrobenzyl esterase